MNKKNKNKQALKLRKEKKLDWKTYFVAPFTCDGYQVYDANSDLVMSIFNRSLQTEEFGSAFANALNGKSILVTPLRRVGYEFFNGDEEECCICVRSWGRLTACLKIPPKEAAKIQDTFAEFVESRIKQ